MAFSINKRIADGGHNLGTLGNCHVFLKDNSIFPWFILVPIVDESITELHQMPPQDFASACFAIRQLSSFIEHHFHPDKINVGAIGNIVRQMHLHVIARFESDSAWPGVVWSHSKKIPYTQEQINKIKTSFDAFF